MLTKLVTYLKDCFSDLKRALLENKPHLYISIALLAIGLLIALSKNYTDCDTTKNFVFIIFSGNSTPIPQIIRLIIWLGVCYVLLLLTSIHFMSFIIVGYGSIGIMSFLLFSNAFIAISVHTLSGLIYTILYLIPTILVGFIGFVCALREIYKLLNYDCNRHSIINISCHQKTIRKLITPIWLLTSAIIAIYWLIFYLILIIFI